MDSRLSVYKQFPIMLQNNICPICSNEVNAVITTEIMLYKNPDTVLIKTVSLPFCTHCRIPVCNAHVIKKIRAEHHGYWLGFFTPKQNADIYSVVKNMYRYVQPQYDKKALFCCGNKHGLQHDIVKRSRQIWKQRKKIVSLDHRIKKCPDCGAQIHDDEALIPFDAEYCVKIRGLSCSCNDIFYTLDRSSVWRLLADNNTANGYTLDDRELSRYTEQILLKLKKTRLNLIPAAAAMISVKCSGRTLDYLIVDDETLCEKAPLTLHYTDPLARELLASAFVKNKSKKGFHNGIDYSVEKVIEPNKKLNAQRILAKKIIIKSGGGFFYRRRSNFEQIVDVLIYSQKTGRYEVTKATYDLESDQYYIDVSLFRSFVDKYGKPDIDYNFATTTSRSSFTKLREESILMTYGYSTAKDLSDSYRRKILTELVDLEIISILGIVRLLEMFISMHTKPGDHYCRSIWEADLKYISTYRTDPQRFLISE